MRHRKFHNFFHYFGEYLVKTAIIIFPVSVLTLIVYFLLEIFKTGLISNYFDLNFLLVLAIISESIVVLFKD